MAEVTGLRNNALPYPVYGAPWGAVFPMLDADGDLVTGATTPDAEVSKNGDTFADCTNESTEIATNSGVYYLLLTGAEMTADVVAVIAKSATAGMKTTTLTFYPRKLVSLRAGTVGANAADGTTLQLDSSAVAIDDYYNGCLLVAVIDSVTEARIISDYAGSTKVCTVSPAFNTAPDNNDTFTVYLPEGKQIMQSDAFGWNGTAVATPHTAGYPVVTVKDGTGTGEINTNGGKVVGVETVDTLTTYTGNTVQTGDSFARIGATGSGLTSLASQASVDTIDNFLDTEIGAPSDFGSGASLAKNFVDIEALVDDIESRIGTPSDLGGGATVAANLADIEAQTDDIGAAGAGLTVLATQASVNTIDDFLDTEIAAIKAKTDNLPSDPADQSALEAAILAAWTTALTESYNADGAAPTPAQALFVIMQRLTEFAKSSSTITVKKLDGSTTAFTLTLDDATNPTSSTRAT